MTQTHLSWTSATLSDVGKKRRHNEDSYLDRREAGLWVVADGMGGHSSGDLASQTIVDSLARIPVEGDLDRFVTAVEEGILAAHRQLLEIASGRMQTMGSTIVALLARGRHAAVLWAGDSRLYRLRERRLQQITRDHSHVNMLLDSGLISADEVEGHPAANLVTRAVGADEDLCLDADIWELQAGDRYLLCSDGLDKHLNDDEIAAILRTGTVAEAARALIEETLERGALDNVTVSVVDITAGEN